VTVASERLSLRLPSIDTAVARFNALTVFAALCRDAGFVKIHSKLDRTIGQARNQSP
jgi:hypothetical protein